mmetsp:Transcript_14549/g.24828  ORF Transcript_14549/g.24828 Transcript_14549/m.24828 type:complete len:145 (-) Transcript_14549:219-653(-)
MVNGLIAGLVSVSGCCESIEPWAAIIIGVIGSLTFSLGVRFLHYVKIDDPLEGFMIHGCCGFVGCLMIAFFKKDEGLAYGNSASFRLLGVQLLGCVVITSWAVTFTFIFFKVGELLGGVRAAAADEILGGDLHYFAPIEYKVQS